MNGRVLILFIVVILCIFLALGGNGTSIVRAGMSIVRGSASHRSASHRSGGSDKFDESDSNGASLPGVTTASDHEPRSDIPLYVGEKGDSKSMVNMFNKWANNIREDLKIAPPGAKYDALFRQLKNTQKHNNEAAGIVSLVKGEFRMVDYKMSSSKSHVRDGVSEWVNRSSKSLNDNGIATLPFHTHPGKSPNMPSADDMIVSIDNKLSGVSPYGELVCTNDILWQYYPTSTLEPIDKPRWANNVADTHKRCVTAMMLTERVAFAHHPIELMIALRVFCSFALYPIALTQRGKNWIMSEMYLYRSSRENVTELIGDLAKLCGSPAK